MRELLRGDDHRAVGRVVDRLVLVGPADVVMLVPGAADHLEDLAAAEKSDDNKVPRDQQKRPQADHRQQGDEDLGEDSKAAKESQGMH